MNKKLLILALLGVLAGCAEVNGIRQAIGLYGANAADQALETALWEMCRGSPVGAIERRFDTDEEKAAWRVLCPIQ